MLRRIKRDHENGAASTENTTRISEDTEIKNPSARLGEILLEERIVTKAQLDEGLTKQASEGGFLGQRLMELGHLDQDTLTLVLVKQCKIPHLNLMDYSISDDVLALIPPELCRRYGILPVDKMGRILTVAMVDPLDARALEAVRAGFPELRIKPILCDWTHFQQVYARIGAEAASEATPTSVEELIPGLPPAKSGKPSADERVEPPTEAAPALTPVSPSGDALDVAALKDVIREGMRETVASLESQFAEASELLRAAKDMERGIVSAQRYRDMGGDGVAVRTQRLERVTAFAPASAGEAFGIDGDAKVSEGLERGAPMGIYTFDAFFVGDVNRGTFDLAQAVASEPGKQYTPFFVCGDVGLGKTHLVNAIGNRMLEANAGLRVGYTSAGRFADHLGAAREEGATELFREAYSRWDALILDDIQFLGGRVEAQEEFFHIFNALSDRGRQIVIAGDRPPERLGLLEKRLVSRFDSGIVAYVKPPAWETRTKILRHHAGLLGAGVPEEVLAMIALRHPNDMRRMIGALRNVVARATPAGGAVSAALAGELLAESDPEAAA